MKFVFEEFVVDHSLFLMTKNGIKVDLEPRVFELLLYFCRHPNIPISREQLIEHVWQQRIVSYAAINRAVSELRKVLEQDPTKPQIITTISKVGYQFATTPQTITALEDEKILAQAHPTTNEPAQECPASSTQHDSTDIANSHLRNKSAITWLSYFALILIITSAAVYYFTLTPDIKSPENLVEQPLTSLKGTANKASQSKDGKYLLFIHKNETNNNAMLWLQHQNDPPQQLTNDGYYYTFAVFGADKQIIASRFNNVNQRKCEIVSIDIRDQSIRPLHDCGERALVFLAYNTRANTLYFNDRTQLNSPYSIYALQLATQRLQQLTFAYSDGNIRGDYILSLSPTADRLAVLEYQKNSTSLLKILHLASNEISYYPTEFSQNSSISWLNNEQVVIADEQGLHSYHLNSKSKQLIKAMRDISFASTNPTTGTVVFTKGTMIANIYQFAINEKSGSDTKQAVTHSNFVNYQPQFANLSYKMAYISMLGGSTEIMIKPEQGKAFNTNFTDEIKSFTNFHWSPNDKYLIASINNQLHMFNETTHQWQLLLPETDNIHYVHFANEKQILFSSDMSGDWQIWQLTINTSATSQLTATGGYSVQGNPSAGYLYLSKFNQQGLYRLNLKTGEEQAVIASFKRTLWNKWQLRNNTIFYIGEHSINAFDTRLATDKIALPYKQRAPASFSVSYDENYLQREVIEQSNANIWSLDIN